MKPRFHPNDLRHLDRLDALMRALSINNIHFDRSTHLFEVSIPAYKSNNRFVGIGHSLSEALDFALASFGDSFLPNETNKT